MRAGANRHTNKYVQQLKQLTKSEKNVCCSEPVCPNPSINHNSRTETSFKLPLEPSTTAAAATTTTTAAAADTQHIHENATKC